MTRKSFLTLRVSIYAAVLLLFGIVPSSFFEGFSLCIFYNLFGIKCIGCGMTRAFSNLMHLNIQRAAQYNPLIFAVSIAILVFVVWDVVSLVFSIRGKTVPSLFERIFKIK